MKSACSKERNPEPPTQPKPHRYFFGQQLRVCCHCFNEADPKIFNAFSWAPEFVVTRRYTKSFPIRPTGLRVGRIGGNVKRSRPVKAGRNRRRPHVDSWRSGSRIGISSRCKRDFRQRCTCGNLEIGVAGPERTAGRACGLDREVSWRASAAARLVRERIGARSDPTAFRTKPDVAGNPLRRLALDIGSPTAKDLTGTVRPHFPCLASTAPTNTAFRGAIVSWTGAFHVRHLRPPRLPCLAP